MTGLLLFALVVLAIVVANQASRIAALARRIDRLERAATSATTPAPAPAPAPAAAAAAADPAPIPARSAQRAHAPWIARPAPPPVPAAPDMSAQPAQPSSGDAPSRPSIESLIGARLPVWIGAAALIAAGFFLARYAIEAGLLGPAVRSALAGLFGALLIAASEGARRWTPVAEDPRVAQALAGAGIASGYGALYLAAAVHRLIPPLPAFGIMLSVTVLALILALRHGPPTAVLALAGGFAAPLVAGYDAAGIAPLLVYLALFTAALFVLAAYRGWAWLAIAATLAGFGWINFLLFALGTTGERAGAAGFAMLLAIGASAAFARTGLVSPRLRLAPLIVGLVQLLAFAPALDFSGLAWAMYLTLAAAALVLAWRDARFASGAVAALALALVLIALGLARDTVGASLAGAACAALLFGGAGLALLDRARGWSLVAVGGIAGPVLIANLFAPHRLADWQWAALELGAALLAALISWRRRHAIDVRDPGLIGGAVAAALLWSVATGQLAGWDWLAALVAAAAFALGLWARRVGDAHLFVLPALALAAALLAGAAPLYAYLDAALRALAGDRLPLRHLPPLSDALRALLPPLAVALALARDPRQFAQARPAILIGAMGIALALLWHLAKLPLAIGDTARFAQWGFIERAAISHGLLALGFFVTRRPGWGAAGQWLFGLGLARIIWFDVIILNPVLVAQQVGAIPLLNAAVLHAAGVALWCRVHRRAPWMNRAAMAFALVAAMTAVRQMAHGTLLTGPVSTGENYGYSAALLLVAIAWLARGIWVDLRDLRLAGLALLTFVTFKVFLIDAAALDGLLRILSFLGLGVALIAIGWVYRRFLAGAARPKASVADG